MLALRGFLAGCLIAVGLAGGLVSAQPFLSGAGEQTAGLVVDGPVDVAARESGDASTETQIAEEGANLQQGTQVGGDAEAGASVPQINVPPLTVSPTGATVNVQGVGSAQVRVESTVHTPPVTIPGQSVDVHAGGSLGANTQVSATVADTGVAAQGLTDGVGALAAQVAMVGQEAAALTAGATAAVNGATALGLPMDVEEVSVVISSTSSAAVGTSLGGASVGGDAALSVNFGLSLGR